MVHEKVARPQSCSVLMIYSMANLVDWLTVHRSITLVDFQLYSQSFYLFIYTGSAQICIHTLTKENSMLNISTKFNYT